MLNEKESTTIENSMTYGQALLVLGHDYINHVEKMYNFFENHS